MEITADPASETVLLRFINAQLLPYLYVRAGARHRLHHAREASKIFSHLKARVAEPYRPRVEEMQSWCDTRRALDLQVRMQRWLHGWLLIHVPVSFLLLIMTAWHAYVTLFKY